MLSVYDEAKELPKIKNFNLWPELLDFNTFLDNSQKAAISSCLNMDLPIVAVSGSAGSGKTTTLVKFLELLALQVFEK